MLKDVSVYPVAFYIQLDNGSLIMTPGNQPGSEGAGATLREKHLIEKLLCRFQRSITLWIKK